MDRCEVCGMISHHGRKRCFHCTALDEAFQRLLNLNPEAAERWATAKQIQAALRKGFTGEADNGTRLE